MTDKHKTEAPPRILHSGDPMVVAWLDAMGITIPWQRVIIDIQVERPVRIHVQALGSAEMFAVTPPDLRGAEVVVLDKPQQE